MNIEKYEYVIGLEIHVKLNSLNKLFCKCKNEQEFDNLSPNTNICPVCTGQPGALPVLNFETVEKSMILGKILNCKINKFSKFDRKSYFYPDLPFGYQITQFESPINTDGQVNFYVNNFEQLKTIGINRAHIENDAGKNIHIGDRVLLDYNRAGTPLVEIVTYPDFCTDEEVIEFLKILQRDIRYNNVGFADLEKGQMRCDVNISVRLKGNKELGTKVELKNLNSLSAIKRAIASEFERQVSLVESGKQIDQETRGWDDVNGNSYTMRSKEDSLDYRYFPDPDLPILKLEENLIEKIEGLKIVRSFDLIKKYKEQYGFNKEFINSLLNDQKINDLFNFLIENGIDYSVSSKWIISSILRFTNEDSMIIDKVLDQKQDLLKIFLMISTGKINDTQAKTLFREYFNSFENPDILVKKLGLETLGEDFIKKAIDEVISENEKAFNDFKNGEQKAIGFLIGQVMKKVQGKADPKIIKELIESK